jgi:hypothetical protein
MIYSAEHKHLNGLLTAHEATVLYPGLNYWRLIRWSQRAVIPAAAKVGRRLFFRRSDLEKTLRERAPELITNEDVPNV